MSIWTFILNLSDLNIHTMIKKIYIEIMPKYHSASKILFYHLPTRGRAGIKLGDAWYVSNVSIIFDCSMLLYLLFWTISGFIFHFYITFGTNLLTRGPAQNCYFLPISVFEETEYQTESKRKETFGSVTFGTNMIQRTWSASQEAAEAATRVEGVPPYLVGPSGGHRPTSSSYIYPRTPKTSTSTTKT